MYSDMSIPIHVMCTAVPFIRTTAQQCQLTYRITVQNTCTSLSQIGLNRICCPHSYASLLLIFLLLYSLAGHHAKSIKPMDEDAAVQLGANVFSEIFIFGTGGTIDSQRLVTAM